MPIHVPAEIEMPSCEVANQAVPTTVSGSPRLWIRMVRQLVRFGLVGSLNTLIDLLALNILCWLWPTQNTILLVLMNSVAYSLGAANSFVFNKYWTFQVRQAITLVEVGRFVMTTCLGILTNDFFVWGVGNLLRPFIAHPTLWTNVSKLIAIAGSMSISYLGMRLWVFARTPKG